MHAATCSLRHERSGLPTTWPSYPITPRTCRPAARARSAIACVARSAPAARQPDVHVDEYRGPPDDSATAATSTVAAESTATVTRAPTLAAEATRQANGVERLVREQQVVPEPRLDHAFHLA